MAETATQADLYRDVAKGLRAYLRAVNLVSPSLSVDGDGICLWGSIAHTWCAYSALRRLGYRLTMQTRRKGVRILRMRLNPAKIR
jgi:hypothetical protein